MPLQEEIDKKRNKIFTDAYPMSVGELVSLYRDGEIDLHPEFQRFFRWDIFQKTRFIESVLVNIPIPSIFVYQRDDGIWDVIDGVQRVSAIFEFIGILEDSEGKPLPPLRLEKGDFLPSLKGKVWKRENEEDGDDEDESQKNQTDCFTISQRIEFKRARIDVKIVKEDRNESARFELFKRINLGGTPLSEQEVRNFLTVMINQKFYQFLKELASDDNFQQCTGIPHSNFKEQQDLELVSKFLIYKNIRSEEIQNAKQLSDFITDKIMEFAQNNTFDMEKEKDIFGRTFKRLAENRLKKNSFVRYDKETDSFSGDFSSDAYNVIAVGIGANIEKWSGDDADQLFLRIKSLWENSRFLKWKESGKEKEAEKTSHLLQLGKELFR